MAAAEERPVAEAVPAPAPAVWPDLPIDDWTFRHVTLTGQFGDGEVHAFTNLSAPQGPIGGVGYFVVAPFTTVDGWHVLVNRGFVPEARKDAATRPGSEPPTGVVTLNGLFRRDDVPNFATPDADPSANRWYVRHIAPITAHFGLPPDKTAPYTVDLLAQHTPQGGLPQAGESVLTFRNPHLGYAFTWFGLAATLAGVVLVGLLRRGR